MSQITDLREALLATVERLRALDPTNPQIERANALLGQRWPEERITGVVWKDVRKDGRPDDDMTVLIALDDGEVWTGFRDGGLWRYVSADIVVPTVLFWAEFPNPPEASV